MSSKSKGGVKKLVTVSVTSMPVIVAREEAVGENLGSNLAQVPCIRYPINFGEKSVSAFFDSGSKVNTVYLAFGKELSLFIRATDVGAQKIDGITLKTYGMVVTAFSVEDKANQVRFLEKTFLVVNVSLEMILRMSFLTLSGIDVDFLGRKLRWRTYTTKETLPTTRHVELVGKKEFATAALNLESETFIVHVASLSFNASPSSFSLKLNVYLSCKP